MERKQSTRRTALSRWLALLPVLMLAASVFAADPAPPATDGGNAPAAPAVIPLADVAEQAEVVLSQVRRLENRSRTDDQIDVAARELPLLGRDVSFRARETQQLLTRSTTLQSISNLEEGWRDIESQSAAITKGLTRSAARLDDDLKELEKLEATWIATRGAAAGADAPPTVLERAADVGAAIAAARQHLLADRARVLDLQGKSADIGARAAQTRQALADAREQAVGRLFYRDSPPLLSSAFWHAPASGSGAADLLMQGAGLKAYVDLQGWRFVLHLLFMAGLAALLARVRVRIGALAATDIGLRRTGKVFDIPLVSALLIGMLASTWFYPYAPRTLWIIISVLGAAPVLLFTRRMIDASLHPVLYAALGFYLADRLRDMFAPLPAVSRLLLLAEALLFLLCCAWTIRRSSQPGQVPAGSRTVWRVLRLAAWLILWLFLLAAGANFNGYMRLADLIVRNVLASVYTAVVLYALMRVGEGVVHGLLSVVPLSLLGMVRRHKALLVARINRWLRWLAVLAWLALTLRGPGLLQTLAEAAQTFWKASATLGSFTLSAGSVVLFFFILWASYTLSRLVRFVLEEEVFPKVRLERGLPYAISTMLHYLLLFSGFVLALGAIGVDMTRLTILVSAFSVGIGFGLQNIVNNFVSGLIVLFERPIKVGDIIQIGDMTGRVQRIGIRASVVLSTAGSEVIIPNGKLISDNVVNWTLSNQLRQIAVPFATKPDVSVPELTRMMLDIAAGNPRVAKIPAPEALFIRRGMDVFEFELRVWTAELDAWLEIKSDLTIETNEALRRQVLAAAVPPPSPPAAPA